MMVTTVSDDSDGDDGEGGDDDCDADAMADGARHHACDSHAYNYGDPGYDDSGENSSLAESMVIYPTLGLVVDDDCIV